MYLVEQAKLPTTTFLFGVVETTGQKVDLLLEWRSLPIPDNQPNQTHVQEQIPDRHFRYIDVCIPPAPARVPYKLNCNIETKRVCEVREERHALPSTRRAPFLPTESIHTPGPNTTAQHPSQHLSFKSS
ncbi:unnamed protein product, partial [Ectocarpus fasciculatus]